MSIRKKRIIGWIVSLALAAILLIGENVLQNNLFKEKTPITVCAPSDMETAFKSALKNSGLSKDYKIVMTTNPSSNICVDYGKEDESSYTNFAYSPFVIAYSDDEKYMKKLKKSEVLIQSEFDEKYYEIDFLRVIKEVIEEGSWANLGIADLKSIKILYPSKETPYWNDFYDFMLVTVNNGSYPKSEEDLAKSDEIIEKFMENSNTEAITNFDEKVERVGGFPENVFFILPEKTVIDLAISHSEDTRILYPIQTINFNYYVKGDIIGNKVISAFEDSTAFNDFYSDLRSNYYRNSHYFNLSCSSSYVYDERDVFSVVKIPKHKVTENLSN